MGIMPRTLEYTGGLMQLGHVDDFGIDPYWHPENPQRYREPYEFVYNATKDVTALGAQYGKKTHLWIQGYNIPAGFEDEIILATDAAYDAGARTILYWSYRGAESNTYRSQHADVCWRVMGEAVSRVRNRHFDRIRDEQMGKMKK